MISSAFISALFLCLSGLLLARLSLRFALRPLLRRVR
jgi:hypothetical protein